MSRERGRQTGPTIPKEALETVQGMLLVEAEGIEKERPDYAAGLKRAVQKLSLELEGSDNKKLKPNRNI